MASNHDYYNNYGDQPPHMPQLSSPSPVSTFDPRGRDYPSQQPTPAPSYHSNPYSQPAAPPYPSASPAPSGYPSRDNLNLYSNDPRSNTGQNPFNTVFDDNVYPVNSRQDPNASTSDMSQQGFYQQDTGYYGHGRPGASSQDIPLQDHPGDPSKNDPEMLNDHVYDAPGGSKKRRHKKQKVALGQLGMIGADKKRIPWVVYVFTVAQVGVFIGELIQMGKTSRRPTWCLPLLTARRYDDRDTNSDQAAIQLHDRAFAGCSDQHGCAVRSLYAQRQGDPGLRNPG